MSRIELLWVGEAIERSQATLGNLLFGKESLLIILLPHEQLVSSFLAMSRPGSPTALFCFRVPNSHHLPLVDTRKCLLKRERLPFLSMEPLAC